MTDDPDPAGALLVLVVEVVGALRAGWSGAGCAGAAAATIEGAGAGFTPLSSPIAAVEFAAVPPSRPAASAAVAAEFVQLTEFAPVGVQVSVAPQGPWLGRQPSGALAAVEAPGPAVAPYAVYGDAP